MSYIAMELVAGRTLRDVLMDGPLPIRRFISCRWTLRDVLTDVPLPFVASSPSPHRSQMAWPVPTTPESSTAI